MKSVPFGPVYVRSDEDLAALFGKLQKSSRSTRGLKLKAITFTVVPVEQKTKKKPAVAYQPYWPWSGFSFWG